MKELTLAQAGRELRALLHRLPSPGPASIEAQLATRAEQFISATEKAITDLQHQLAALQKKG